MTPSSCLSLYSSCLAVACCGWFWFVLPPSSPLSAIARSLARSLFSHQNTRAIQENTYISQARRECRTYSVSENTPETAVRFAYLVAIAVSVWRSKLKSITIFCPAPVNLPNVATPEGKTPACLQQNGIMNTTLFLEVDTEKKRRGFPALKLQPRRLGLPQP